uniref:Uncharacterized protein n=1 Tax=Anguilla anguilla TaxID=7936 RepID=A0A0E9SF58_ANGAN
MRYSTGYSNPTGKIKIKNRSVFLLASKPLQ